MVPGDKEDTHGETMLAKNIKQPGKHSGNKLVTVGQDCAALTL